MRGVSSQEASQSWAIPLPRHRYMRSPSRADKDSINLDWIGIIHPTEDFGHHLLSFHRFRVEVYGDEKMSGPRIDFVLSNDCSAETSSRISEENVPEAAVLVEALEIARFEMNQVRTRWASIT